MAKTLDELIAQGKKTLTQVTKNTDQVKLQALSDIMDALDAKVAAEAKIATDAANKPEA